MGERVKQAEAVRRLGVSNQVVSLTVAAGNLAGADGLVDLDELAAALLANRNAGGMGGAGGGAVGELADFRKSRSLREHYTALDAKLSYERTCGLLIEAAPAARALVTAAATMRLTLEALPDKLAPRLAAETDPGACAALLEKAVDEVLDALQDLAATLAPVALGVAP
jgi:hypothetical protein